MTPDEWLTLYLLRFGESALHAFGWTEGEPELLDTMEAAFGVDTTGAFNLLFAEMKKRVPGWQRGEHT
jgi:hypothetical protein